MHSFIFKVILLTVVLYKTTEAAVALYPPEDKPSEFEDEPGCYLASLQLLLEVDIPYSPQDGVSCKQYTCKDNGVTQLFTCGVLAVNKGCEEIEGDKYLPYPDCCNTVRCVNEDETCTD